MEQLLILGLIIAGAIGGLITYTAQRQENFAGLGLVGGNIGGIFIGGIVSSLAWVLIMQVTDSSTTLNNMRVIQIMNIVILILCTVWGHLADAIARGQAKRLPLHIGRSGAAAGAIAQECYMAFAFLTTPIAIAISIVLATAGVISMVLLDSIELRKKTTIGWISAFFAIVASIMWFSQAEYEIVPTTLIWVLLIVIGGYMGGSFVDYVNKFISPPSTE